MMRRRVGLEHVARTAGVVARIAVAGALAAGVAFAAWYGLDDWLGRSAGAQVVSRRRRLSSRRASSYAGAARPLGVRELEALLLLRARRDDPSEER